MPMSKAEGRVIGDRVPITHLLAPAWSQISGSTS